MKLWTVYSISNSVNSRLYIGVHKTVDPNDSYMGSGKLIQRAIEKHGLKNFHKEILLITEDKEEAFALEKQLVTLDRIESGELYNLKEGGEGGWDLATKAFQAKWYDPDWSINQRLLRSANQQNAMRQRFKIIAATPELYFKFCEKRRIASTGNTNWLGKFHSEATKAKMSASHKGLQDGPKNSQFGTRWMTKDGLSSKFKAEDVETKKSEGWVLGRKPPQ